MIQKKIPFLRALLLILTFPGIITTANAETDAKKTEDAIFAGGCFWCMEPPFDKLDGVISTTSGYISGHQKNPTYKQVTSGKSGHTEAVKVVYDPKKVSYKQLLDVFWVNIDPLNPNGQFCDYGTQYRTGIYYLNEKQLYLATASASSINNILANPVVTEIVSATTFYPAEEYHQDYYQKNPVRYNYYRWNCGRDNRLEELWGVTDKK